MDTTKEKRVLVTGGAGFIGSTFLNYAVNKYPHYTFINVDVLTPIADLDNITVSASSNYHFEKADICDLAHMGNLFKKYAPSDIIHFAAETHVDVSIVDPGRFIQTNIVGTHNLLSLALEHNIERFHHISTDEVYGALSPTDPAFTEETPLAPNSPYSASKAGSDMLVRAFHKTYELNTVITRCSNNYGPRQDKSKFIPRAITALRAGEKIPVYGKGEQIRDWLYVEDHVQAIDIVFHNGISGEIYNVGGGTEKRNIEIAQTLADMCGRPGAIEFVADRKGHDFRYAIHDAKIRALGYAPLVPFTDGLKKTLSWYQI